ncbi:ras-related protein Rab-33B-like [Asbolus verrucosus]|uniref:Ras-related protein Rab-33B-like n=1 Tax=Asbolus verrucosus TaxID=1661398 RepID=A0A482V8N6_ASBVE|nr:ras-related protein Rab-33B-like [Asbolus verrucosus]
MENPTTSANSIVVPVREIKNYKKIFKVIVIGDSNVGKTSLTFRFCEGAFLEQSEATIGVDFRSRTLEIDGEEIVVSINASCRIKNTHAIVLVYDVTSASSFDSLKKWVDECNRNCLHDIPRILVGNKCDGVAAVTTNVAQRFADQYNMPLFETSARLDSQCDNIEAIFLTLAHKLKNQKQFLPITDNIKVNNSQSPFPSKSSWRCCY